MARLVISDGIRSGDVFVPGQLFAFGSIVLHANQAGRLGQVGSFTPDQEIRFGNLGGSKQIQRLMQANPKKTKAKISTRAKSQKLLSQSY